MRCRCAPALSLEAGALGVAKRAHGCQVVKGAPEQALSLLPVFPILFIPNEILLAMVCQSGCLSMLFTLFNASQL